MSRAPDRRARRARLALVAGLLLVVAFLPTSALGADPPPRSVGDDDFFFAHHDHQHGGTEGHLTGSSDNVDLVGQLKLTNQDEDISDVSALQAGDGTWYAYVGDWGAKCQTGGVHVVDISDPASPVKVGFLNSGGTGYVTEGVQALSIDTDDFTGDILVVSNEWCLAKNNLKQLPGGITIWDITDPTNPSKLVHAFGDDEAVPGVSPAGLAHEAHSAIAWDAGDGDAYVAAIDNYETFDDVDIFEITDPSNPVLVSETGLLDWPTAESVAFGEFPTSHDMDVIEKEDGFHLMVSYWDTGWVDLNVEDPENPTFVEDSTYAACDQVIQEDLGYCVQPEGNAHQGEWNADGSLFIGTDEDFGPNRADCAIEGVDIGCSEFGWTAPLGENFPTGFSGSTVFGGEGCPGAQRDTVLADHSQADTGADAIAFLRGTCFFSEKVETGELAGYDMVIIINNHAGALNGVTPNAHFAGGQGSPVAGTASAVMIGHANGHELFADAPTFTPADDMPALGTAGLTFDAAAGLFDGWGYVRLLDSNPDGGFTEIDQLAIDETSDPAFDTGFGDLTVHEVEVPRGDPNEGGETPDDGVLAYFSWYAGGFRVAEYDSTGITEVGHYVDANGNNFWGVALAKDENDDRIVLASDRDYGLFIFRYTGS